jgi:predicted nucleotidyltransferase
MKSNPPTPHPEVNAILQRLTESIQSVLGKHLIGMYLEGSLANGDFDQDSDIDFVVVTDVEVTEDLFSRLQSMHDQIATIDSPWAIQLEGSYLSQQALRRYDPTNDIHPNIERGLGERLKLVRHQEVWNVHRHILRERGITIVGPEPKTLIDPITPTALKQAMLPALSGWATYLLHHPNEIVQRGYQSYIVLTLCRILYTLQMGEVVSKLKSANWAKEAIGETWKPLIEDAWEGRHASQMPPDLAAIRQTQDFIEYALEVSKQLKLT